MAEQELNDEPSIDEQLRYLWEYSLDNPKRFPAALSAVRRGAGRQPGTVPEMWQYHVHLDGDERDRRTNAEHVALVLFGFHQQSSATKVHRAGARLGAALWRLRDQFSSDAVDARFFRAVTAADLDELATHLRGLVMQLRSLKPSVPPIDYSQLVEDLTRWQDPAQVDRVRRKWASEYHKARSEDVDATSKATTDSAANVA